jgi:hypothetical protein
MIGPAIITSVCFCLVFLQQTSGRDSAFARAKSFFSALSTSVSPHSNPTRQPSSTRQPKGFSIVPSSLLSCEPTEAVVSEQPKEYYSIVESPLIAEEAPVPESSNGDVLEVLPSQLAKTLDHPLPPAGLEPMEQPTSWMDIDRADLMDIEKQRDYVAEPVPRKRVKAKRRHVEAPPPASVAAGEHKPVPEPFGFNNVPPKLVVGFSSVSTPEPVVGPGSVLPPMGFNSVPPKLAVGPGSVPPTKPTSPRQDAPLPLPAKPAVPKSSHRKSPAWCSSAHTPVGACAERGPYTSASGSEYYKYYWDCCGSQAKSPKHHSELEGSLPAPKLPSSKPSYSSQSKKFQTTPKQAPASLPSAESPVKNHIGQRCRNGGTKVGECKIYGPYAYGGGAPSYRYKWTCCGSAAKNPVHHV